MKISRLLFSSVVGGALSLSAPALAVDPPISNAWIEAVALGPDGCLEGAAQPLRRRIVVPGYCVHRSDQKWDIARALPGKFTIRHQQSGMCITMARRAVGTALLLTPCQNLNEQRWKIIRGGRIWHRICNDTLTLGTTYCLEAPQRPGEPVRLQPWRIHSYQLWNFE